MAYSQIEIASAPYGHVLRDHNLRIRDRERECSSKARSAFQKNIDEMVRDHLSNCWVGNEERNSFGVISMTERDENQVESEAMRRQSRILDRWAARQAREMITTLERQTHEAELLALSNVQTVSERTSTFLRETSPAPSDSSVELPNLKASSLVQMWKEFEAEAISPRGNQSGSMNSNFTVGNSRLNSAASNIESASVGESSLGSEIFDAVEAPEDSFVEWESEQTASSGQHHPSLERQVSNVSEGTRVADIVRRLTSVNQTTHSSLTSSSSSCIEHDQEPPAVSEPSTPVDHSVSNQGEQRDLQFNRKRPRVRGREAIKDLFMQMERERQSELSKLAERHAVSMFPHRGRIQSLLRLKFLQREVVVQDQQRPASTASELNQLHGKSTIFLLREIFTVKSKQEGSASVLNEVTFQTRTQSLNATQESGHSSVSDLLTGQEVNHDAVTGLEHSVEIVTDDGSVPSTSNHSSPTVQQSEPSRCALKGPTVPYRSEPSVSERNWSTAYRSVPSTGEHNGPTVDQSEPSTSAHKGPTAHHSEPSISERNGPTAYRSVPSTSEHNGSKFHQSEPSKSEHKGSTAHHSEPSISERNGPTAYRSVPSTSEHNGPKFHQSEPSRSEHKGSTAHHSEPSTSERNGTTAYHLEQSTSEHIQESDCWMSDVKRQDLCVDKFNSKGNIANEKDSNVWQRDVLTEGTELNTTPNTGPFDSWEMLTEEPDYNTPDLIQPTDGSWLNDVSPPPRGWECRRQTWYSDIFENDSDDEEIHELLERRTVSNLLASSFRERMDRLILSQLQRHLGILVDAEEVKLGETIEYHYQEMGGDPDQVDSPSFQLPLPSRLRTRNQDQDHDSDLVAAYTSLQPPQPSSSDCQDSQQCSPFANPASLEMELIYDLKGHMERLQYEMSEIRKSIQSCVGMQVNLQNSIKQEVAAAVCRTIQGGEANSVAMRTGNCCICHSTQVDSLLYRCGHMCTCFKCAQELQWSRSSCPICRSEIVDVVRAYAE